MLVFAPGARAPSGGRERALGLWCFRSYRDGHGRDAHHSGRVGCGTWEHARSRSTLKLCHAHMHATAHALQQSTSDGLGPWASAVIAAILGAAVGVLLSALYGWYQKRLGFLVLLREVKKELATANGECSRRIDQDTGIAGAVEPPLPTEAWRALVATGDLGLLDARRLRSLRDVSARIVAANHIAAQWCCLLQIALLSPDSDTRDEYNAAAASALSKPCKGIADAVGGVICDLDDEIMQRQKQLARIRRPWSRLGSGI